MNAINVKPMANQFKVNQNGMVTDFYGSYAGNVNNLRDTTLYGNTHINSVNSLNNSINNVCGNKIGDIKGYDSYERHQQTFYRNNDFKKNYYEPIKPTYNPPSILNKYESDDFEDDNEQGYNNKLRDPIMPLDYLGKQKNIFDDHDDSPDSKL